MVTRILVAYARRPGVLADAARAIAETFEEAGVEAVARPADEVDSVSAYDSVVLVGQMGPRGWRDDAVDLLSRFRVELCRISVAYAVGVAPEMDPVRDPQPVERGLAFVLDWFNELRPVKLGLFHMGRANAVDAVRRWAEDLKPNFIDPSLAPPAGVRSFLQKPEAARTFAQPW